MMIFTTYKNTLFIALFCAALAACDSGSDTEANPFNDNNSSQNNGPAAATEDARKFEVNLWNNLKAENRCGQCHSSTGTGQNPLFAETTDVNIAYSNAVPLIDLLTPSNSLLVTKVGSGHQCWENVDSVCADSIENMIGNWVGSSETTTSRDIVLTAPVIKNPGDTKTFPNSAVDNSPNSFAQTVHPIVEERCAACHYEEGLSQQQSPFFANPDPESAFQAAKPKMNIDLPSNSLLVQRLAGAHNCWSDCEENASEMQTAIETFADGINATTINTNLITSKALNLFDGVIASGGNRHEANMIALWEFKVVSENKVFDTSGIEPAMNLDLIGSVAWLPSYGLDFTGGRAQAATQSSKKLHDFIKSSGEYSLEAWVIPANVAQEDANIISYDAGATQKNFTLSQTLYNYNFHNRSDLSDANGDPAISTPDADEVLQSTLQHIVVSYDPVVGRKIYVNGELIDVAEPVTGSTTISNWNDSYAFVLGQSAANNQTWLGQIRLTAIHNRVLTSEQVAQNHKVGVGQKYFLLFSIADQVGIADSYIRFQVSLFDSFSYLFENPTLINLDPDWIPGGFAIKDMRIGINGKEAIAGQTFANMDVIIDSRYSASEGQTLSSSGTVIALEKGADSDEFFLTFETLSNKSFAFNDPIPTPPPAPADAAAVSDIGVRTFDEINATIAKITNIPITNSAISSLFQRYEQQLPTIATINAFLPSHQMAIAQIALTSCSERVDIDKNLSLGDTDRLFTNFDFNAPYDSAFNSQTKLDNAINPILIATFNSNLDSQPDFTEINDLLGSASAQTLIADSNYTYNSLIVTMKTITADAVDENDIPIVLNAAEKITRTEQIIKAMCAAAVGSAAMLIQ